MRILHVINSLATGGAEKLLLETIPKYNEQGIVADVLLLNGTDFPFLQELRKQNCCKIYLFGTGSPYSVKFILKLIPYLRKYELIHAHLFPANYFIAAAKILSFSPTPVILTEHNTSNRRFRNPLFRLINALVYKQFTTVVCINQEVANIVLKKTILSTDKVTVIYNGVDTDRYSNADPAKRHAIHPSLSEGDFILVQVSSFRQQKDQQTLISALKYLPPTVKLLFVGDGPLRIEHEKLAARLVLENRIFFLGNRMDIASIYKACNIGILSSHYEGFGLVAVEGMASGRPFVASDVPGLSEVVGGYGVLFPQGDEKKLAGEIIKLMEDQKYYREVGKRCAARAQDFDIQKMVQQHIALYRSILAR